MTSLIEPLVERGEVCEPRFIVLPYSKYDTDAELVSNPFNVALFSVTLVATVVTAHALYTGGFIITGLTVTYIVCDGAEPLYPYAVILYVPEDVGYIVW
jgi:hypothetical protein